MEARFKFGDMVQVKRTREAQFLNEEIEGTVVGITQPTGWNPYFTNDLHLYLIQDSRGAHYNLVDGRYLELSNAPKFEPKRLRKGCMVCLSPHTSKKNLLHRGKHYSVKEVEDNMATLILGEGKTIKVHAEDLKVIR